MTETIIICTTALIALGMILAGAKYAFDARLRTQTDATQMIKAASVQLHETMAAARDQRAALAGLSERVALFESALKETVKQLVAATGYSEEKYKQLVAKNIRGETNTGRGGRSGV